MLNPVEVTSMPVSLLIRCFIGFIIKLLFKLELSDFIPDQRVSFIIQSCSLRSKSTGVPFEIGCYILR